MIAPVLRVARPSNDIDKLSRFYHDGLGLDVLFRFENHAGFDGIIFGKRGSPFHFEFTTRRGHIGTGTPTKEDLLVFYIPELAEWHTAIRRVLGAGFVPVRSANPYWDQTGVTFVDPEGYRVVLENASGDL